MNEHAGFASALSVLIVGVFAILLHDRKPAPSPQSIPRAPAIPARPAVASNAPLPVPVPVASTKPQSKPEPSRPVPTDATEAKPAAVESPKPAPIKSEGTAAQPAKAEQPGPRPVAQSAPGLPAKPAQPAPRVPKASFTTVLAGEKLVDVANRIYGTSDAAESLWKANRDQVAMIDSPLTRGTLLRTP